MYLHFKQLLGCAAIFCLTIPVWAATESAQIDITQPTMIGSTQLQPGNYVLKAEENNNQVKVVRDDGKFVAEVPCQWTMLQQKPSETQVQMSDNRIIEVDFGGKVQAVKIS